MEEQTNFDDILNSDISIEDTSRQGYNDVSPEAQGAFDTKPDTFEEVLSAKAQTETASKATVDTTDYNVPYPKIKIASRPLFKILSQLTTIIDLNSQRAVSRGITLEVKDINSVDLISPNEIYYFKATLECETDLPVGTRIFLDYSFLQKMARFIPQSVLIYKKEVNGFDKYYIRLSSDDLELLNVNLIEADAQKLVCPYNIIEDEAHPHRELEPSTLAEGLQTMTKVINFESDTNRRTVNVRDKHMLFRSPLVYARAKTEMEDLILRAKELNYILKTISLLKDGEKLKIYDTDSQQYPRRAIVTDNTMMITNFAVATDDTTISSLFDKPVALTPIAYGELKYQLEYASAITYAIGVIEFKVEQGKLNGNLKLNNGSLSPLSIPIEGDSINIPEGTTFKVNTKTFLNSINSMSSSLELKIGLLDGMLYLVNNSISLILITI